MCKIKRFKLNRIQEHRNTTAVKLNLLISFVCLFVWFFVQLENFSLIWRRHHCRWRTVNFELCSALMVMSSEGSLACHTYCDTGHHFRMVISEDPWHSHLLQSVWKWSCHYLFLRLRSYVVQGFKYVFYLGWESTLTTHI